MFLQADWLIVIEEVLRIIIIMASVESSGRIRRRIF
jgi:hypothetical protein